VHTPLCYCEYLYTCYLNDRERTKVWNIYYRLLRSVIKPTLVNVYDIVIIINNYRNNEALTGRGRWGRLYTINYNIVYFKTSFDDSLQIIFSIRRYLLVKDILSIIHPLCAEQWTPVRVKWVVSNNKCKWNVLRKTEKYNKIEHILLLW